MKELYINNVLEPIKEKYKLTNKMLSNILDVSEATISQYIALNTIMSKEKGHILDKWLNEHEDNIYNYIFNLTSSDGYYFHGSKNIIEGEISPYRSKNQTDFGEGFYIGESFLQSATWASAEDAMGNIYKYEFDYSKFKVRELEDLQWVFFVAYNRNRIPNKKETNKLSADMRMIKSKNYDVLIGKIADDKMAQSMKEFFTNSITDQQLFVCLELLNIGKQYCLKTIEACHSLKLIESFHLNKELKELINEYAAYSMSRASDRAHNIIEKKGFEGKTFNTLMEEYGK